MSERSINEAILGRAVEDAEFRKLLLDDPEAAVRSMGLAEQIEALDAGGEVEGHGCSTTHQGCGYWSSRWYCPGKGWKFGVWPKTG